MLQTALDVARANRDRHVQQLAEFLRIPSISTLPEFKPEVERAAEWLAEDLRRIGMRSVEVIRTAGHPLVYADWLDAGADAPTILVYGHYDVQPVDPLDEWTTPPFEPDFREGRIYARGATDDKGQVIVNVKALESVLAATGRLQVNVRGIFEGEEESGGLGLEQFVVAHRDRLAADAILISDSTFITPGQPSIPYSVRGISAAEVHVCGPKTDLHSGGYGGTVHNPASVLAAIIAALHDGQGRVQIPGFYDHVRALPAEEREALGQVPYTLADWQTATGLTKPWGEAGYTLIERTGVRPTCEVNGMWGGFQGVGSKTIIPAEAHAKITMRLVPDQDPHETLRLFTDYVLHLAPDDVTVTVDEGEACWPAVTPIDSREIAAASRAYEAVWGRAPILVPGGGSIPIIATFQRALDAPVVMMGFGVPDSGVHAPNEFFPLAQFYGGIEAVIHFYYALAGQ